MIIARFIVISFLCIWASSCKAPSIVFNTNPLQPLPTQYTDQMPNAGSAEQSWRTFFKDSLLISLIDTALVHNLDLLRMQQRIAVFDAQVLQAQGRLRPFVAGTGSVGMRRFGKYTMDGVGNFDTNFSTNISSSQRVPEYLPDFFWGVQSSWEIDIYKKLRNQRQAAISRYMATLEGRNLLITHLVSDIANTYYDLISSDLELDFIRATIMLQRSQLDLIRLEKEAGRSTELAVQQFEAQLLNAQALEKELLQQINFDESRINFILGRFSKPVVRNKISFTQLTLPSIDRGSPADLLKNRPDIRRAEYEVMAAKADVAAARAAFLPSLNLGGSLGFQAFNPRFILSPHSIAFNLLGGITAPLVNKTAIQAEFNVRKASQLDALYNYQQTILNGYLEVHNQWVNISNLAQIYDLKTEEAKKLENAVETASQLYLTGRATYLEILLNRQNAIRANLELIEIKQQQFNATVTLYRALGGGWR
ncbi:TolC family protein [Runella slithyformis]|uniref:RND efflux system, outer membrane lipoprotein, NodT family n=1 Tax=Runella slithyformis (strain ATCC 29530 / DSM 19594 / LMG 11500 / NCIMB 11436 / LSU 4) TaxID=761193 RepID=A0A7U3ZL47_RUNSL|nr:TolC family protein [Runella slithyformis]AEI49208.1 RND efflux system, outer membrane lipoprotein, NodT family [Runella slithyformis DSM 19594]